MDSSLVAQAPPHLLIEERGNGFILRDTLDNNETYLNRSSALIWCLCDGESPVQDVIDTIHRQHPDSDRVELDVLNALRSFVNAGLLRFTGTDGFPARLEYRIEDLKRDFRQRELEAEGISATPVERGSDTRRLTVAMATYDDFDGTYFTVQAIRLYHREVLDDIEFVVLDNNPRGKSGEPLRAFADSIPNLRYVPEVRSVGTAVRGRLFDLADTPWVICLDCHVMLVPGALARLLKHIEEEPGCIDLLQGPLISDRFDSCLTHMEPEWRDGMYGTWAHDSRGDDIDGEPFEIPMQGLGLFACRKAAWPAFNDRFRGFGGEEGYLHGKFRAAGGRTLCLPYLRWLHRFGRPGGVPYPIRWEDRILNYFAGFNELGWDTGPVKAHFAEKLRRTDRRTYK